MPILEARQLTKRFGDVVAVDGVSFAVEEGEVFGLLGPNGAGKSTTIRMLTTLLRPTSGGATVAGHDVATESDAVRRAIGLVGDKLVLYRSLSVRRNCRFFGGLYGLSRKVADARLAELAAVLRIEEHLDTPIGRLSTGLRQRANLARALLPEPRVLFLDEPTLGLDVQSTRDVRDFVLRINRERRTTVILTTHQMSEVELMADRVCVIDGGRIVALGKLADVRRAHGATGGRIVEVTLRAGAAALAAQLGSAPGVESATAQGETVRILTRDEHLDGVLRAIHQRASGILEVHTSVPRLEDVFLSLTKPKPRAAPAGPAPGLLARVLGRRRA